ncbi:pullulanase-type alpha-1,6-glucosidase [Candidatus Leptofilum sp.]|uniref:pullulanase-type alpha-1,6-glucosidase n=1 Tax=Candidatus Leptofilum sp. TaxID=3241576 RepID=UPI003B5A30A7
MNKQINKQWSKLRLFLVILLILGVTAVSASAQTDDPASIPPPDTVTIAGTIQSVIGCAGEWDTTCAESQLTYDAQHDIWLATFDVPAGNYEYKAALNGTWDDNYGLNAEYYGPNIPLEVPEDGPVTFWYDHKTRWVSDSINSLVAAAFGDFQEELGCAEDWSAGCLRAMLQDPNADGIYTFITASIPAGEYEAQLVLNQSWEQVFGADGEANGANHPFTVGEEQAIIFAYDPATNLLTIEVSDEIPDDLAATPGSGGGLPPAATPFPDLVVIPGTIQSVLGCAGDWAPDCTNTELTYSEENQLFSGTFDIPAGEYEYKVALNGSWDVNFGLNAQPGGANIPLSLAEDSSVTFYFDNQTGWVADSVNNLIANVPGSFQDELGCAEDWMPSCLATWLQDPDGDSTFTFQTVSIPVGEYEAKVAVNGTWDVNYGEDGAQDGANIPFSVQEADTLVTFTFDSRSNLLNISVGSGGIQGNISQRSAYWVAHDTIAWNIEDTPGNQYFFHYDPLGGAFSLGFDGISGGEAVPLTVDPNGFSDEVVAKFPHLQNFTALKFSEDDLSVARVALKGQIAVSAQDEGGQTINAAGLQTPGVLDDLYPYDGDLGVTFNDGVPTLTVWAPTARQVRLYLFDDADPNTEAEILVMRPTPSNGTWSLTGEADWADKYYLYEVQVYVPTEGSVQTNLVTDPYSFSLATNSTRSQIVDLTDAATMPDGWLDVVKPGIAAPEDIIVYELHVRDFSVNDASVPEELRGTYAAFTQLDSNGMQHLAALSEAGLTHLHLLPTFDIATIDEDKSTWTTPTFAELANLPADSEEQQALISAIRDQDPFNWGYDPFHYTVPEGSYSVNPGGIDRIKEYRQMVQALNEIGLHVVVDVVYNHTNASGQANKSVLDQIVPGYYHRLNSTGNVETSTCCQNTATEHNMMRKLMIDSVVTWAVAYKIDAFRFDLMGHHMMEDMLAVRAALDALTLEEHGVDGKNIYVYGEGWDFGEVGGNARGLNATQFNMAGTGIGTFSDRLRDAARGGSPFGGQTEQGFLNGLYVYPNETDQGSETEQWIRLQNFMDIIRVGLAGNLSDFTFVSADGTAVSGSEVLYNGSPAGYTADPQEQIVYISKHDNESLFDIIQYKAPLGTSTEDRARMQTLGNSIVMFSQGIPFFQAGDDLLRSKSLDRNSYNSGDWFNRLDFTYQSNNWGIGLPPAADNQSMWPTMQPLLANPDLAPTPDDIAFARDTYLELLQIRAGSPLFRLQTAVQIQERLMFHNTGAEQLPGVIVMSLSDLTGEDLDPNFDMVVVVFNATPDEVSFTETAVTNLPFSLHPIQQNSVDGVVQTAAFDDASGTFTVPAWTTAVFALPQGSVEQPIRGEETAVEVEESEEAEVADGEEAEADAETTAEAEEEAHSDEETEADDDGHAETEIIQDAPGTPWALWLSLLGGGFVFALLIAWLSQRKRQSPDHH